MNYTAFIDQLAAEGDIATLVKFLAVIQENKCVLTERVCTSSYSDLSAVKVDQELLSHVTSDENRCQAAIKHLNEGQ